MKKFVPEDIQVNILGKDYKVKELSLAQKIKIIGGVAEFIRDIARNAFFKKADDGKITFNFIDEISLAELNVDRIILNTLEILPELLAMSIPDFTDWNNVPESQTREALSKVLEVNDMKGFVVNFISLASIAIR